MFRTSARPFATAPSGCVTTLSAPFSARSVSLSLSVSASLLRSLLSRYFCSRTLGPFVEQKTGRYGNAPSLTRAAIYYRRTGVETCERRLEHAHVFDDVSLVVSSKCTPHLARPGYLDGKSLYLEDGHISENDNFEIFTCINSDRGPF